MPFIIICAIIAFLIQLVALYTIKSRLLRLLVPVGMELLPACIAVHALITKPGDILGWEFTIVLCLWMAGAILLGCALAYVFCLIRKSHRLEGKRYEE